MTVSYNTGPGGLMYAPARDFAHNYPQLVACVRNAFVEGYWPTLTQLLGEAADHSDEYVWDKLCDANDKFAEFIRLSCRDSTQSFDDVLAASGWSGLPEFAKVGWLAMLGTVMMGQLFQGLRDITAAGLQAPSCMDRLMRAGFDARRATNRPNVSCEQEQSEMLQMLSSVAQSLVTSGVSLDAIRKTVDEAVTL